jgi:hypothetical protein
MTEFNLWDLVDSLCLCVGGVVSFLCSVFCGVVRLIILVVLIGFCIGVGLQIGPIVVGW